MKVIYRGNQLEEWEKQQIWEILCQCDDEFYPRLSARESSSQKNLLTDGSDISVKTLPTSYFAEMILQDFILAYIDDRVIGFMTFKQHYLCDALSGFGESLYITTVCVRKECRGKGAMSALYQYMEQEVPAMLDCYRISTRTWSLNEAQLHELPNRGYDTICILPNDRGNGVDTIYFGKSIGTPISGSL
ncbi:MAG: GNAT family N-acetyltransferase [Lachnospiraceae bacterium]